MIDTMLATAARDRDAAREAEEAGDTETAAYRMGRALSADDVQSIIVGLEHEHVAASKNRPRPR
jgi:hypothetical protein